jgi:hypothetical protein
VTKQCSKCQAAATHIPRLVFFAFVGAAPSEMFFNYPVCAKHAVLMMPGDLLTDDTWRVVTLAVVGSMKLAPKRELTKCQPVRISSNAARKFFEMVARGKADKYKTGLVN